MPKSNVFISFADLESTPLSTIQASTLTTNDIIIYSIFMPNFIDYKAEFLKFLNTKELNRAERFHKEVDKDRFIIYKSIIKLILATYTQLDVKDIKHDYHFNKKPYLASHPWLNFNVSHSKDYAIIAISRVKVGIDIEYMNEDKEYTDLLIDVFSTDEILNIKNAADQKNAFYTLWTRKEAFVKALGKGIDDDFNYIPSLNGHHKIDSTILKNNKNWQVCSFHLADNYSSAICFEGLPSINKNLIVHTLPSTMKELLEMFNIK